MGQAYWRNLENIRTELVAWMGAQVSDSCPSYSLEESDTGSCT